MDPECQSEWLVVFSLYKEKPDPKGEHLLYCLYIDSEGEKQLSTRDIEAYEVKKKKLFFSLEIFTILNGS